MTPEQAGAFLKKRRLDLGYTADQILQITTVPHAPYLSQIEGGKPNPGRSKHFPSLARALRLTEDEIRRINPDLVVVASSEPQTPFQADRLPDPPQSLKEAIKKYGGVVPEFRDPDWIHRLQVIQFRDHEVKDADGWLDIVRLLKKTLVRTDA